MKGTRSTILILFLLLIKSSPGQFFGIQFREQFYYCTILNYPSDGFHRVLAMAVKPGSYPQCKIYRYNSSLLLTDSLELIKGAIMDRNEPTLWNNRLLFAASFYDSIPGSNGGSESVLEVDTGYHHIALHKIKFFSGTTISVKTCVLGNSFYVGFTRNYTSSVIYKLDHQFQVVDSVVLPQLLFGMEVLGDKIILSTSGSTLAPCTGNNGGLKIGKLDSNLTITSCYSADSVGSFYTPGYPYQQKIGIRVHFGIAGKAIPISSTRLFAAGYTGINYQTMVPGHLAASNTIFDRNLNVISTTVHTNSASNVNYFDFSNFASCRNNEIVTVACVGNDFQYPGMMQPQATKILITNSDTLGNLRWAREFGGDMFYRPNSIAFATDGGYVVSGRRYDSTRMHDPDVSESFLLKLDKNGFINPLGVSDHEKAAVVCYPNPATDNIRFILPDFSGNNLVISDICNQQILSFDGYKSGDLIDLSRVKPGIYLYCISGKGYTSTGKFIKTED
jgi:hypothetical protein